MLPSENLITTLDKFKTAVYLKDTNGHYLSMNTAGMNIMKGHQGRVLGRTTYELFDRTTANIMIGSDQCVMKQGRIHTTEFDAIDRVTGEIMPMFNAKTAIFSPSGQPLGVVGISIADSNNSNLFSEVCRLLPQFVQRKQPHLLNELLELRTVMEFTKLYQLH